MSTSNVRLLRLNQVIDRVGFKRSTIYELISQKKFPKPVKLGVKSVAWVESEIEDWIQEKITNRF